MSEELEELISSNPEWYKNLLLPDVKTFIKANIESTSRSFIAIGYYLKYVRDNELFKEDGYSGILEFAQSEFGISKSWASKWMSINDQFSVSGNSPILLEQYKDFSSGKLSEMLYLSDEQREQITITTTTAEIREIKSPVKEKVEVNAFSSTKTEKDPKKPYYECAAYRQHEYSTGCKDCFYEKADCPYDRVGYFEKLKQQEEWCIHCEVLKEMCNSICKMSSYILEKNNYDMETIKGLSRKEQEFSFGFGGDDEGHSKYSAWYKPNLNRYHVEELHGDGKWIFEAGEVDQDIWNFNSRTWKENRQAAKSEPKPIDDLELSVRTYNCLKRSGVDTIDKLCKLTEIEVEEIRNISHKCMDEIKLKLSEIGRGLKPDNTPGIVNDEPEIVDNDTEFENDVDESEECSWCKLNGNTDAGILECHSEKGEHKCFSGPEGPDETEPDYIETVEADIIQTEPISDEPINNLSLAKELLSKRNTSLSDCIRVMGVNGGQTPQDKKYIEKLKIEVVALAGYIADLDIRDITIQIQPDLLILKNNDTRKDFIDNYPTWPIWIDTELTGERYYRYDFENNESFVIRVSLHHPWEHSKYSKEATYGCEEYFLLGAPDKYKPDNKTFHECSTNKSAMIDYLKELQKK